MTLILNFFWYLETSSPKYVFHHHHYYLTNQPLEFSLPWTYCKCFHYIWLSGLNSAFQEISIHAFLPRPFKFYYGFLILFLVCFLTCLISKALFVIVKHRTIHISIKCTYSHPLQMTTLDFLVTLLRSLYFDQNEIILPYWLATCHF